jgi:hypothetical protein
MPKPLNYLPATPVTPAVKGNVVDTVVAVVKKVLDWDWSDNPEGFLVDPIPNPKRYFNLHVHLLGITITFDVGTPGIHV